MAQVLQFHFLSDKKQILLSFNDSEIAEQYKLANPEARILQDESPTNVWLPLPPGISLQNSDDGMNVIFDNQEDAVAWRKQVILGTLLRTNMMVVHLKNDWTPEEIKRVISRQAGFKQQSVEYNVGPQGRSTGHSRLEKFGNFFFRGTQSHE